MKIPTWNDRALVTSSVESSTTASDEKRTTSQHQPATKAKKSVAFADYMVVFEIPTRASYTPEERQATWYSGSDYDAFDRRDYCLLDQLNALGRIVHPQDDSARGLEGHTQEASVARRHRRYQATAAVLNEQYRQRYYGVHDDEHLAREYHAVAWHSQYVSYTQGMVDEQESLQAQDKQQDLLMIPPKRVSDCKNVLRNVISIERGDSEDEEETVQTFDTKCSLEESPAEDFMLHSFFQDLYISVAAE